VEKGDIMDVLGWSIIERINKMCSFIKIEFKDKKFKLDISNNNNLKEAVYITLPISVSNSSINRLDIFDIKDYFNEEFDSSFDDFIKENINVFDEMIEENISKLSEIKETDILYNFQFIYVESETGKNIGLKIIIKTLFLEYFYHWLKKSKYIQKLNLPFNEIETIRILVLFNILKLMISEECNDFLPRNKDLNDILKLSHFKENYLICSLESLVDYICDYASDLEYISLSPKLIKNNLIHLKINEIFNDDISKPITISVIQRFFDSVQCKKKKDLIKIIRKFKDKYLAKIVDHKSNVIIEDIIKEDRNRFKNNVLFAKVKKISNHICFKVIYLLFLIFPVVLTFLNSIFSNRFVLEFWQEKSIVAIIIIFTIIRFVNDEKLSDFPRLFGSLVVGYSLLLVGDEVYTFAESLSNLQVISVGGLSILTVVIFIRQNIVKYFIDKKEALQKSMYLYYRVYVESLIGIYILSPLVVTNFITNKSTSIQELEHEIFNDIVFPNVYNQFNLIFNFRIMIVFPILAVMIGIFLQLLWDDNEIADKI
jgi:hypothetical protein